MIETTLFDSTPVSDQELEQIETELKEVIKEALGNEALHNDICHRKAVKVAKLLIEKIDLSKYQVRLVQITGHSAVSVSNISMTSITETTSRLKILINTGYPPDEIPNDYYTIPPNKDISSLLPDNLDLIESIPLLSVDDAQNAIAWSTNDAKRNKQYYS